MPQPLVPSKEACERLGIDRSTLMRWVAAGRITPALKGEGIRGPMWFNAADVDRLSERSAS